MPSGDLYVGVDGGGTRTTALLARHIGSSGAAPEWNILEQIVEDLKTRGLRPDPVAVVRDPALGALMRALLLAT